MVEVTMVQWVMTIIIAIVYGVAYSLLNYLTKTTPEKIDPGRLIASIIFGVFVGLVMIYQEATLETIDWTLVGTVFFAYQGAELSNIYENAFNTYWMNQRTMFRYARRRKAGKTLQEFIQIKTVIQLETKRKSKQ